MKMERKLICVALLVVCAGCGTFGVRQGVNFSAQQAQAVAAAYYNAVATDTALSETITADGVVLSMYDAEGAIKSALEMMRARRAALEGFKNDGSIYETRGGKAHYNSSEAWKKDKGYRARVAYAIMQENENRATLWREFIKTNKLPYDARPLLQNAFAEKIIAAAKPEHLIESKEGKVAPRSQLEMRNEK